MASYAICYCSVWFLLGIGCYTELVTVDVGKFRSLIPHGSFPSSQLFRGNDDRSDRILQFVLAGWNVEIRSCLLLFIRIR